MLIHTADPITVVSVQMTATLNTLTNVVGNTPQQLYSEFEAQDIPPAGPMLFVYRGMDGDPDSPFELEVALPIDQSTAAGKAYSGERVVKTLTPFDYVEKTYVGAMENMGKDGYEPLFIAMAKSGIESNGEAREIYVNWAGPESPENRTDIQIGVNRQL